MTDSNLKAAPGEPLPVEGYYRWQSRIYDATRWSFLFGRSAILDRVATRGRPARILEIGCGTGKNLAELARRFPQAHLTGIDVSADMLERTRRKLAGASQRTTLLRQPYDQPLTAGLAGFDLVLCSYALSMFNPGWEQAIDCACSDLAPNGLFALVDFHYSAQPWFRSWMAVNHVRMEKHLLPVLKQRFEPVAVECEGAYGGLWQYLLFVGKKKTP